MPARRTNLFAGNYLARVAHRRLDEHWLAAAARDPATLIVPVVEGRNFVCWSGETAQAWFLEEHPDAASEWIFLGEFRNRACFAVELSPGELTLAPNVESADLRTIAWKLPADEAGVLAYARALMLWRERHRFCGRCGTSTRPQSAGHVLVCSNENCGQQQFPRIDPAIITAVAHPDGERCLLGRQAAWPPRRYSTIAGFVEPGESLEDAVMREVHEETGIELEAVEYHSSQPWPFPSSLMVGFIAHARTTHIQLNDEELEDARWFSRTDIANGRVYLPLPTSVSYRLIEDWYDARAERPLREELEGRSG